MLPTTPNGAPAEPQITNRIPEPKGVLGKNTKGIAYLAVAAILILGFLASSFRKKPAAPAKDTPAPVTTTAPESTAANVAAFHTQLRSETPVPPAPVGTAAQQVVAGAYGPNGMPAPGGVAPAGAYGQAGQQPTLTPEQQQVQQLAAKERERQYASRFESNLAFSRSAQQEQQGSAAPANSYAASVPQGQPTSLTAPRAAGEQAAAAPSYKRAAEVNLDAATGQPYVIDEGLSLDTVLMNRLDGDAAGPVKVLVSNPVYSHDHQHVLIPEGTTVLGEARKLGASGFGQQRRMAVVFHRMIMPDGYSVDLDQFHGLDQIGEEGLKDKVNNHYLQIFGTSIALGVVSGAAQITQGGSAYNSTGSQQFVNGAAAGVSQQATTVLDRFIQIPPTITIREGHRVKVYFTQDTGSLVDTIGADSANTMMSEIGTTLSKQGTNMTFMTSPYAVMVYWSTQVLLSLLSALTAGVIAYGALAATVIGLLGPIFIPWLVFEKTEFLFWGWIKAYISFEFYKVVAAAVMYVMGNVFVKYYQNFADYQNVDRMVKNYPVLLLLVTVNVFIILKIPAITASLFSGSSGGHDAGMGMAMMAMRGL